jgi:hypothetical protein
MVVGEEKGITMRFPVFRSDWFKHLRSRRVVTFLKGRKALQRDGSARIYMFKAINMV